MSLIQAVKDKDITQIQKLIESNYNLDEQDEHGNTALIMTCDYRYEKHDREISIRIFNMLIHAGCNINIQNKNGIAAIFKTDLSEKVKILIDNGADINVLTNNGYTPLLCCNNLSANYLIDAGADIHKKDQSGFSALWHATEIEDIELIKLLIENNIKIDNNALIHAVELGYYDIMILLIKHGENIFYEDEEKLTCLTAAIRIDSHDYFDRREDFKKIVLKLIELGSDIDRPSDIVTPLTWGCKFGYREIVKNLISQYCIVDPVFFHKLNYRDLLHKNITNKDLNIWILESGLIGVCIRYIKKFTDKFKRENLLKLPKDLRRYLKFFLRDNIVRFIKDLGY